LVPDESTPTASKMARMSDTLSAFLAAAVSGMLAIARVRCATGDYRTDGRRDGFLLSAVGHFLSRLRPPRRAAPTDSTGVSSLTA